jgi:hypothetical protein
MRGRGEREKEGGSLGRTRLTGEPHQGWRRRRFSPRARRGGCWGDWAARRQAGPRRGWATRGKKGGGEWAACLAGPRAWLGRKERGKRKRKEEKGFFPILIYFQMHAFTNSLNEQNRCMDRHGASATTKRFNSRVLLTRDLELHLARIFEKEQGIARRKRKRRGNTRIWRVMEKEKI